MLDPIRPVDNPQNQNIWFRQQPVEKRREDGQTQGARRAATGTYRFGRSGSEHRATPQLAHRSSFSPGC